jgi:hypothetical protein
MQLSDRDSPDRHGATSAARPMPAPKTLGAPEGPLDLRAPLPPSHPIPQVNRQQSCLCFVAGLGRGMHALHSNMDVVKAYAASVRAGTRVSRRQAVLFFW